MIWRALAFAEYLLVAGERAHARGRFVRATVLSGAALVIASSALSIRTGAKGRNAV